MTTPQMTRQPKRARLSLEHVQSSVTSPDEIQTPVTGDHDHTDAPGDTPASAASSFRNVSACDRCRKRKNRCDQKLPSCSGCEKAGVQCVGYDPVLKRVIPRSYFFYLENRVTHLEAILQAHGIPFPAAEDLSAPKVTQLKREPSAAATLGAGIEQEQTGAFGRVEEAQYHLQLQEPDTQEHHVKHEDSQATSPSHDFAGSDHRAATSAISFARIMYAAVEKSMPHSARRPSQPNVAAKDSFFGLCTPSTVQSAPFPAREVANRLINYYFEYSNPQIPTLHRPEYEALVNRVYATEEKSRSAREMYFLNIVAAIGAGIFVDNDPSPHSNEPDGSPNRKRQRTGRQDHQPEEYHAAAMEHLRSFAASPRAIESTGDGLEELQAVLLLAGYALLRPSTPGLWYISGVATRQAVDLGLYIEDSKPRGTQEGGASGSNLAGQRSNNKQQELSQDIGRRQWTQDMRRRLWLCVYSFDRLVAFCVGRPVSVSDTVITTKFPSLLDDKYITPQGIKPVVSSNPNGPPSYKYIAQHYFHLRLLQSEILDVLQNRQAQIAIALRKHTGRPEASRQLSSSYLTRHKGFREWRIDVDCRLWEWFKNSPTKEQAGVAFEPIFFELNYRQTVVMLYRHSLAVPSRLANELDTATGEDSKNPRHIDFENEDDQQTVFLKVAEAGYKTLRIYRQLHNLRLVNYTYLGTHHLFMCGISLLYAIWHSPLVRSKLAHEEVDLTFLAATTVLNSLIPKCPPAQACRDALKRMAGITIAMCLRHTGFGADAERYLIEQMQTGLVSRNSHQQQQQQMQEQAGAMHNGATSVRPMPDFDEGFRGLFSENEIAELSPMVQPFPQMPSMPRPPPRRPGRSSISSQTQPVIQQVPWQQQRSLHSPPIEPALQSSNPFSTFANTLSEYTQTNPQSTPAQDEFDELNALLTFNQDYALDPSLADPANLDYDLGFGLDAGAGAASWNDNDVAVMMTPFFFGEGPGTAYGNGGGA